MAQRAFPVDVISRYRSVPAASYRLQRLRACNYVFWVLATPKIESERFAFLTWGPLLGFHHPQRSVMPHMVDPRGRWTRPSDAQVNPCLLLKHESRASLS